MGRDDEQVLSQQRTAVHVFGTEHEMMQHGLEAKGKAREQDQSDLDEKGDGGKRVSLK